MAGEVTTKPALPFAAGMLLGLAGGAFAGYKWAERKLGSEFEERLQRETEKYRVFYNRVPGNKFATPQEAVSQLIKESDPEAGEALKDYQGPSKVNYNKVQPHEDKEEVLVDIPESPPVGNVFQSKPDKNNPYVISQEEYMAGEAGHEQFTLTYYAKDDVLADERDEPVENKESTVGLDSLVSFGVGSSDPRTVHVRNHYLKVDFEVLLNDGSFAKEVLGLDADPEPPKLSARQRRETGK